MGFTEDLGRQPFIGGGRKETAKSMCSRPWCWVGVSGYFQGITFMTVTEGKYLYWTVWRPSLKMGLGSWEGGICSGTILGCNMQFWAPISAGLSAQDTPVKPKALVEFTLVQIVQCQEKLLIIAICRESTNTLRSRGRTTGFIPSGDIVEGDGLWDSPDE